MRRGEPVAVEVRLLHVPPDVGDGFLSFGVEFQTPQGTITNSYLPSVPSVFVRITPDHRGPPFVPFNVGTQFVMPRGTPVGNSFIPEGSRVLELRTYLSLYRDGIHDAGPGRIASYPVID